MKIILKKTYTIIFFALCLYHILSLLFGLDVQVTSKLILILVLLSLSILSYSILKNKMLRYTTIDFIYLLILIAILLFHYYYYSNFYMEKFDQLNRSSVEYITSFTQGSIAWLLVGVGFFISNNDSSSVEFRRSYYPILSLILLTILILYNNGISIIDYQRLRSFLGIPATHLSFGSFIIYLLIVSQVCSKQNVRFLIFLSNILILYIIGGRSDLIIFFITTFLYYSLFERDTKFILTLLYTILSSVLLITLMVLADLLDLKSASRFISAFSQQDESRVAREQLLLENIVDLPNKILVGDPNFLIDTHSTLGGYIHNIFSAWEFYGFITFTTLVLIMVSISKSLLKYKNHIVSSFSGRFASFIWIFILLQITLSKSILYYPLWFSIGFTLVYISYRKKIDRINLHK